MKGGQPHATARGLSSFSFFSPILPLLSFLVTCKHDMTLHHIGRTTRHTPPALRLFYQTRRAIATIAKAGFIGYRPQSLCQKRTQKEVERP